MRSFATIYIKLYLHGLAFFCALFISSCHTEKKAYDKITSAREQLIKKDSLSRSRFAAGTDFIAMGYQPIAWKLEMDFDKNVIFKADDGTTAKTRPAAPAIGQPAGTEKYLFKTNDTLLTVTILKEKCKQKMPVLEDGSACTIQLGSSLYEGCGQYLKDYRLNDVWILDHIDNEEQFAVNYTWGLPEIRFDLLKKTMNGFDGCRKIDCGIQVKGNHIVFDSFRDKPISCDNEAYARLLERFVSSQWVAYFFRGDQLVLQLINDTRLSFTRKMY